MILDRKQPVPDSPPTPDCPPSYDTLVPLDSTLLKDIKPRFGHSSSSGYGRLPTSPLSPPIASPLSPNSSSSSSKGKGKARSWFDFAAIRTSREVHATISGLVRDLVRDHYADSAAPAGILQSCADACAAHDLNLSSILQDKFIEGHTPLYWAIVKRKPDEQLDDAHSVPDLLTALISHTAPLTHETIAEIRLACLVTSDQKLFQRLRMSPEFSMVSGAEQMLLGVTQSQDEVEVHEVAADDGSFAVDFVIPHFQKRLRVAQNIELEFIARSRMWKLAWVVAKPHQFPSVQGGSWCIVLSLQENSPPTWLDSRLVVYDPETSAKRSQPPSPSLWKTPKLPTPSGKPPIDIRLQTSMWQLEAIRGRAEGHGSSYLIKPLEKDPSATTLQYNGTSYIAADEKLRGRFEAKLQKPTSNDADCIIC